jgi:hypothetical protein
MGIEFTVPVIGDGNAITGLETTPRNLTTYYPGTSTSVIFLAFCTARAAATVTKAVTLSGTTAAGATPTSCRVGVYEIDGSGGGTLVASTANTTSLWASTFTKYETALSSSLTLKAGQRYAMGIVIATGAALPTLYGTDTVAGDVGSAYAPRTHAGLSPASGDLPASFVSGDLFASTRTHYVALVP